MRLTEVEINYTDRDLWVDTLRASHNTRPQFTVTLHMNQANYTSLSTMYSDILVLTNREI
jgi:hypothetical protein